MLTIRKEQMAVLSAYMRETYFQQTLLKLARLFPDDPRLRDETTMRALVETGIQRAASYGIVQQRAVTLFIFLQHEFGPNFEKQPDKRWMERILTNKDYDGEEKLDVIYKRLDLAAGKP
jgi:hypothetical protein